MILALFSFGPFELLIISGLLFVLIGIPLLFVVFIVLRGSKRRPPDRHPHHESRGEADEDRLDN